MFSEVTGIIVFVASATLDSLAQLSYMFDANMAALYFPPGNEVLIVFIFTDKSPLTA